MTRRRQFMQMAGAGFAALARGKLGAGAGEMPDRLFEHGQPLSEFSYGDVTFAPGLQQAQLEQTHAILMGLDQDSLLRPYRMAAGLPAPGNDLGGWYSAPRFLGETLGQWISALSRYYAAMADDPTRLRVERLIDGFAKTIEPTGKIFQLNGNPMYFHDKLVSGIEDSALFAGSSAALKALSEIMSASKVVLEKKAAWLKEKPSTTENYNFAETYFNAWQRGGDQRYFEIAKRDLHDGFIDPLAEGQNVLAGRHAYSHVNGLCGAVKAYLVLGDEKYLKAGINGLAFAEQQSFVTGGYGPGESFLPKPALDHPEYGRPAINVPGDSILHEHYHFETPCGAYAHLKLTRYLIRITKNSKYGDSMERVMYNTVLGALPLNKFGKAFYQSNYHHHARKEYFDGYGNVIEDEWPCCSGTLPQVAADYRISTYFRDGDGIYVNLYIPSTLRWRQSGTDISLTQTGQYPLADSVMFNVSTSQPVNFAVRLRIPAWLQSPSIRVNGKQVGEPVQPGTFASFKREWKAGDRIELELPRKLDLKAVDEQHPDLVALVHGPIVLFVISDDTPKVTRAQLLAAKQKSKGSEEWSIDSANGPLKLLPWWSIKGETYFTYLRV